MLHPDQRYIDALVNNDTIVLHELYQKYSGKIKWLVLKNSGTASDAADIFQEALLSIYNKAKTQAFILTCPLDAFLYLVCKNKWMNELSKRKSPRVTIDDVAVYNLGEDPIKQVEELILNEQRNDLLNKKIAELGENCRQLLRLSWTGKPMEEVANILNVSYGYVRKKKCECMAKLTAMIKQSDQFNSLKW